MGKLRIFYSFPDRLGGTGIGTTALQQIRGLIQEGCAVTAFCTSYCVNPSGAERKLTSLTVAGWRLPHRFFGIDRAYRIHDWRAAKALGRMKDAIDVVHCWPSGSLATLTMAAKLGIPSFLERPNSHTASAYEIVGREYAKLGLKVASDNSHACNRRRLEREEREFRRADRLLVPSDFVMQTFLDRGFGRDRLVRHRYGFDPARFFPPAAGPQTTGEGVFTAAFVGLCDPRKGLHHALRAWHESGLAQRGRFLICGDIDPRYRQVLSKWLAHPSIQLIGFRSDVREILQQSHVLVLPSLEEGSALVTYEARACGCVLLVSDRTGAICRHMREGLIHPAGDVGVLRRHLLLIDRDRELLRSLRRQSLEGLHELTWESAARRLIEIYRECTGRYRDSRRAESERCQSACR